MSNNSTDTMKQPEFVFTAQPVCFVRAVTPLTTQIDISRVRTDEFCMPVYAAISDDDIRLKDEYIAELQAQGVDKLAAVTAAADSVCAAFNEPDMCDSCSDKLRGGCQPTCNQYQVSNGHD